MSNQGQREVCLSPSTSWAETDNGQPLKTRGYYTSEFSNLFRGSTTVEVGGITQLGVMSIQNIRSVEEPFHPQTQTPS